MYIRRTSPDLRRALLRSNSNKISVLSISHLQSKYDFVVTDIIKNLELGRNVLYVVPDDANTEFIAKLLSGYKLSNIVLTLNQKKLEDNDLIKLKALYKNLASDKLPKDYEIARSKAFRSMNKVKLQYKALNKNIIGKRSWKF